MGWPYARTLIPYFSLAASEPYEKFTSKELVGESLKKSEGITEAIETASARFEVMNQEPPKERRAKVSSYKWVDRNSTGGYDLLFEKERYLRKDASG